MSGLPADASSKCGIEIGQCVTEWEYRYAMSLKPSQCIWIRHRFADDLKQSKLANKKKQEYCDFIFDEKSADVIRVKHATLCNNMMKVIEASSRIVVSAPTFEEYVKLKGDKFNTYVNHRHCVEALYHLVRDGSWKYHLRFDIINSICSFESICAHLRSGQGSAMLRSICSSEEVVKSVKEISKSPVEKYDRFEHYLRWIHSDISRMTQAKDPALIVTATATSQTTSSHVRKDMERLLKVNTTSAKLGSLKSSEAWWRSRQLGGFNTFFPYGRHIMDINPLFYFSLCNS